jgi:hypothetical protein
MTQDKLKLMLAEGYNLNQIAAIHMISKAELEKMLEEKPTKKIPKVETELLFPDEPGL